MKCWYLIDTTCDRPPGICEGCQKYEDWRKQRNEIWLNELKKKAKEYNGYPPNLIPESIWRADFKRWKEEKNKNKGDENE